MPTINVDLPLFIMQDIKALAMYNGTDENTIILCAIAEFIGETKYKQFLCSLKQKDILEKSRGVHYQPVIEVKALGNNLLHLIFKDGLEGNFDLIPLIEKGGVYSRLIDDAVVNTVRIGTDGEFVIWNEDLVICAEKLYRDIWFTESDETNQ